eukprot:scaffold763_cov402-Prasinococcus_capsulatus_cf.AAC.17
MLFSLVSCLRLARQYSKPCPNSGGGLEEWLWPYTNVDVYLVHIGTNNVWNQENAKSIQDLKEMVDAIVAHRPSAYVLLSNLIPLSVPDHYDVEAYNAEIPMVVQQYQEQGHYVFMVDNNSGFDVDHDTYDKVHPNTSGDEKMASKFEAALKEHVCCDAAQPSAPAVSVSAGVKALDDECGVHGPTVQSCEAIYRLLLTIVAVVCKVA